MQNVRSNEELLAAREAAMLKTTEAAAALKIIEDEISAGNMSRVQEEYRLLTKQSGSIKIVDGATGIEIVADIKKTADYDQDKLREIASSLAWDQTQRIFTIKFGISERVYNDIADPELKTKIDGARTVKYSEPKITLKKPEPKSA